MSINSSEWRDTCSDDGRIGDGSKQLRTEYLQRPDFTANTIAEQNEMGGYNRTDRPVGGPGPQQRYTHGSAESE